MVFRSCRRESTTLRSPAVLPCALRLSHCLPSPSPLDLARLAASRPFSYWANLTRFPQLLFLTLLACGVLVVCSASVSRCALSLLCLALCTLLSLTCAGSLHAVSSSSSSLASWWLRIIPKLLFLTLLACGVLVVFLRPSLPPCWLLFGYVFPLLLFVLMPSGVSCDRLPLLRRGRIPFSRRS